MTEYHCFVVLAHGDSPFLEGCIEGLFAQTVKTEVLIATSTPSPFIASAARRFGAVLTVNPQRIGIAADWNFGFNLTPAKYVTLAHQDDTYDPRFVECTLELFKGCPEAALCFTGYREIDNEGKQKTSRISVVKHLLDALFIGQRTKLAGARLRAYLAFGNPLPCSSVTFNRARLLEFRFSLAYNSNLDWDAWLRLQERGEIFLHEPERLIGRRHNPMTATSRLIGERVRHKEDLMMFRRIWPAPLASAIAYLYRAGY